MPSSTVRSAIDNIAVRCCRPPWNKISVVPFIEPANMRTGLAVINAFDRTTMETLLAVALLNLACSEPRLCLDPDDRSHVAPSSFEDEHF